MLYIPPHSLKLTAARTVFHSKMIDLLYERIDNIKEIPKTNVTQAATLFDFFVNDCLEDILIGEPAKLLEINTRLNPIVQSMPSLKKAVEYVFNYDWFCGKKSKMYCAYNLAAALDINTCVYCNRNYTSTVIKNNGRKITRPQFDHFFDKGTNPLLSISFYNLIPSCSICNSGLKGAVKMDLDKYLHPYIDDGLADTTFNYRYSSTSPSKLEIKVKTTKLSKASMSVNVFALEDIYNSHISELQDLLQIKNAFSDRYLDIVRSSLLKGVKITNAELYRILFGTEYAAVNFVKRPFSKFKSDILKQLGIISST
jgi:hypothetical protein